LRCTFTGKNICLVPLGEKKILAQSESSNPPPQKATGPPLNCLSVTIFCCKHHIHKACLQCVFFYVELSALTAKIFCCKHHIHKVCLQCVFSYVQLNGLTVWKSFVANITFIRFVSSVCSLMNHQLAWL
jgi:hypothetical protein